MSAAWVVGTVERDLIPEANCSAAYHVGIEHRPAAKSAADIAKHLWITLESVRIDRRYRAAAAPGGEPHQRVSNAQMRAFRGGLIRLSSSAQTRTTRLPGTVKAPASNQPDTEMTA
jgi:multidrug efflux pump subunit AcrA (membrane-fusion protein)